MVITNLAIIGLICSMYALYIKYKMHGRIYKPMCDINEHISCTKALKSKESQIFTVPNAFLGLFLFAITIVLDFFRLYAVISLLYLLPLVICIFLLYTLYKQRNWCIVCLITHAGIIGIFLMSLYQIL
jgi:vitamin-K-epoxide reductase (warfarin-sensitive)